MNQVLWVLRVKMTLGTLFEDLDLTSTKLGKTDEQRNTIISKVLSHLDKIDFQLENTEIDVLGDAYEYLDITVCKWCR